LGEHAADLRALLAACLQPASHTGAAQRRALRVPCLRGARTPQHLDWGSFDGCGDGGDDDAGATAGNLSADSLQEATRMATDEQEADFGSAHASDSDSSDSWSSSSLEEGDDDDDDDSGDSGDDNDGGGEEEEEEEEENDEDTASASAFAAAAASGDVEQGQQLEGQQPTGLSDLEAWAWSQSRPAVDPDSDGSGDDAAAARDDAVSPEAASPLSH
jgi:hypothetical protein